ncbi:glycosyltransferase [Thomasclavelia spiroformis]|uniref:glycosyltransferase n=1 Tax=Thomasclavelia spiroformis TaxID=29348 RepID=UPI001E107C65|nr:glycosyltransferase [Thomasclavelia spiroformis]MBS7217323.1 glycosyltransferase [Thomasclavelia spiroformis]
MDNFKNNVTVMILFFTRPDTLEKVFASVREAKPSRLFLFQDGARNSNDLEKIEKCRSIVENIDWNCEVKKFYSEKNMGCDKSQFAAFKWAFQYTDRLIFLEDDCVPSQSFFPFCEELLEKYKNDERIHMICGMNHVGDMSDTIKEDYFFAKTPTIWGWATWKRAWENWDTSFDYLNNDQIVKQIYENIEPRYWAKFQIQRAKKTYSYYCKHGKINSFELLNAMAMHLQSAYVIIPTKNMISNIGISEESVHNVSNIKYVPIGMRRIFNMKTYELTIDDIKHPRYLLENKEYRRKLFSIMGRNNKIKKFYWKVESKLRRMFL